MERVRCYFDVEVDEVPLGRIIFELFNDACPRTCENFRALCTGELGEGKTTGKQLHYRNVKFHRVIKDFMVQAGDFSAGNGTGGESIYGGQFEDETFELKHDTPFLLSMANRGKDTNGSQFFITTQTASHLDGKHVVFGRVISGQEVVVSIENLPVDNRSRPLQQAIISNCGELILQRSGKLKPKEKKKKKKAKETHVSDSEEEDKKKLKKKKKEKKTKKDKLSDGEIDDEMEVAAPEEVVEEDDEAGTVSSELFRPHPLASVSTINPDEIPEVPRNRFLDRGYQNRLTNADGGRPTNQQGRNRTRDNSMFVTRSGRKVKGRGSLRYRTPSRSRSRSRSQTPPHWRQAQRRTVSYEKYQRVTEIQQERDQEIEDRRQRRQERHKLLGFAEEFEEERDLRLGVQSVVDQKQFSSAELFPAALDDKTERDWRVARHETSIENKENKMRSNGRDFGQGADDLRNKIKDRFAQKNSGRNRGDRRHINKDEEDLDENALNFEAPSEEEDSEKPRRDRRRPDFSGRSRRVEMAHYRPPHRDHRKNDSGIHKRHREDRRRSRSRSRNRAPPRRVRSPERARRRPSPPKRGRKSRSDSSESD